jgi:hypothetical protein
MIALSCALTVCSSTSVSWTVVRGVLAMWCMDRTPNSMFVECTCDYYDFKSEFGLVMDMRRGS